MLLRQIEGSWVSIKPRGVPAKLLRTIRYYMPPRITRNSHRPGPTDLESQIELWLARFSDHAQGYSNQTKQKQKENPVDKMYPMDGSCDLEREWAGCQNYSGGSVELFS